MEQYISRLLVHNSGLLLAMLAMIIRYRHLDNRYLPLLIYLCVAVLNEVVSFFTGWILRSNAINNNLFMLLELLLLNWQFKKWGEYSYSGKWYNRAAIFFIVLFAVKAGWKGIGNELFYFNMLYCCYLVTCGMESMCRAVLSSTVAWYKNADFILCLGMVFYFGCRVIAESFWLYGMSVDDTFRGEVDALLGRVDFFVNFIYLYAILWIPKKANYISYYGPPWYF